MKRYRGNQVVDPGVYFNLRRVCFRSVEEAGRLPGSGQETYRCVPALALLVAAPLLGLVYVVWLISTAVLAGTAFPAILADGAMHGWLLFVHVGAAGPFLGCLTILALIWARSSSISITAIKPVPTSPAR